jgi:hypothetical protein
MLVTPSQDAPWACWYRTRTYQGPTVRQERVSLDGWGRPRETSRSAGVRSPSLSPRFADRFARRESRQQAARSLRGLLAPVEREKGWEVAETVGDATPDRGQRLLFRVDWEVDAARERAAAGPAWDR